MGSSWTNLAGGRRRLGFTLIELMIVIAIIAILASLIIAGVSAARRKAAVAQAKSDINTFAQSIKAFELDEGYLPGKNEKWDGSDESFNAFPAVYTALCGPPGKGGGKNAPYFEPKRDSIIVKRDPMDPATDYLVATGEEGLDPEVKKYYADPWLMPYIYRENKSKLDKKPWMIKPYSYDLWSTGLDKKDESIYGLPETDQEKRENDDIGNW